MEKKQKITIIGLASLSIILLSSIILLTSQYYRNFTLLDIAEDNNVDRYVSEGEPDDHTLAETIPQEETSTDAEQGELEEDTNRQVININKDLTDSEKEDLEDKYDIEFSDDESNNGIYVIEIGEDSDLEGLEEEDSVENIETDVPIKMFADTIDWGINRIGANSIWETSSGAGIKIAVIDTGIQTDHPDLSSNIIAGYDFVNNDTNAYDDNGHGTHVAGIIAATQNQAGTIGASYSTKLMPIKVLNSSGYGYLSDVAQGIYFAANNGARIINLSLGTSVDSYTLKTAIIYAANRGVLVVAAAGNSYGAPCSYPAAYSSAVCVVATDSNNRLASFSNVGGELSAPGVSNYSTFLGSTYRYLSGTSMATPHVAGAAATVMAACTDCSTSEVRSILRDTAIDLGAEGQDIIFGYGLVDLVSAIDSITEEEETDEEIPTEDPVSEEPDETTDTPSENIKYEDQRVNITFPETARNSRYIHLVEEDITVKFELTPTVEVSGLEKTDVTLNNELIYTTTKQTDEFEIDLETLDHSQHWLKATSYFKDGKRSRDYIVIDMTYLDSNALTDNRGRSKSVLGISTSVWDFASMIFKF